MHQDQVFHGGELAMTSSSDSFFKCTRWQVEETTDLVNCPYHYFCASSYAVNYPPIVDFSVLLFTVASIVSAAIFTVLEFRSTAAGCAAVRSSNRRYLLPSGPIALPVTLLILANGLSINTMFPLSHMGPALLQLLHISALAFRNRSDKDVKYVVLEAWTVSGILQASLYLDSVILPYYTGLEALTESSFSGVCASCVCRKDALVVGGRMIPFRGWSATTFLIASALCSRMACRVFGRRRLIWLVELVLEITSWVLVAGDSIHLTSAGGREGNAISGAVYGAVCCLVLLNVLRLLLALFVWSVEPKHQTHRKLDFFQVDVSVE